MTVSQSTIADAAGGGGIRLSAQYSLKNTELCRIIIILFRFMSQSSLRTISGASFLFMTVFVYNSSCVCHTGLDLFQIYVTKLPGYSCKHFGIPGKHFPSKGNRIGFSVAFDANLSELALRSVSCDYMVLSSSHLLYVLLFRNTLCFLDLNWIKSCLKNFLKNRLWCSFDYNKKLAHLLGFSSWPWSCLKDLCLVSFKLY